MAAGPERRVRGEAIAGRCGRRTAEHQRRHKDRTGRCLPAARARPPQSDARGRHACPAHQVRQGPCVRHRLRGPGRSDAPVRRTDCAVRRSNRLGTPVDAIGRRTRGCARHCGYPGRIERAGRNADERPSRMGVTGGLDADARPSSGGSNPHHAERSGDQAVHAGLRGNGGGSRRRSRRSAPYRCRADAPSVQGQAAADLRRSRGGPAHRASLRQRSARCGDVERRRRARPRTGVAVNESGPGYVVDVAASVRNRPDGSGGRYRGGGRRAVQGAWRRRAMDR